MKAHIYRMVVSVLDMENMPLQDVVDEVERSRHVVIKVRKGEVIAEPWADDHPLNRKMTYEEYEAWWARAAAKAVGKPNT